MAGSNSTIVSLGQTFPASEAFQVMFRDGMALVEEAAAYLDGPGREQARRLDRSAALAYATESMRLTTQLMSIASWLLLMRSVKEDGMNVTQFARDRNRTNLKKKTFGLGSDKTLLPLDLQRLISRAQELRGRVLHADQLFDAASEQGQPAESAEPRNPVHALQEFLRRAFE